MMTKTRGLEQLDQQCIAQISPDGKTISGNWEFSEDGSTWEVDFDLTYRKVD